MGTLRPGPAVPGHLPSLTTADVRRRPRCRCGDAARRFWCNDTPSPPGAALNCWLLSAVQWVVEWSAGRVDDCWWDEVDIVGVDEDQQRCNARVGFQKSATCVE